MAQQSSGLVPCTPVIPASPCRETRTGSVRLTKCGRVQYQNVSVSFCLFREETTMKHAFSSHMSLMFLMCFCSCYILFAATTCDPLPDITNGNVSISGTSIGSTATYFCEIGFILAGNKERICQNTGQWSGTEPSCKSKAVGEADTYFKMLWIRQSNKFPSLEKPGVDHNS